MEFCDSFEVPFDFRDRPFAKSESSCSGKSLFDGVSLEKSNFYHVICDDAFVRSSAFKSRRVAAEQTYLKISKLITQFERK